MSNFLTKILGDRNEWKSMEARADALPRDYRIVYAEIMQYMWKFSPEMAWTSSPP
jgi:DNA-binding ferritin-like protein (Dps family)